MHRRPGILDHRRATGRGTRAAKVGAGAPTGRYRVAVTRSLVTAKSTLVWSADLATVTKRATADQGDEILGPFRRALLNEIRVNRLFIEEPPPVATPALVAASTRGGWLEFAAVRGDPIGPKFPLSIADNDLHGLIGLAHDLDQYRPRRRWFRRLRIDRRLRHHVREGLLEVADAEAIVSLAARACLRYHFAHGDLTARNVLRGPAGDLVLIDWEWAGYYPAGYELAFLWFSLVDAPGGRAAVERAVSPTDAVGFLVSAVVIQLLHLHLLRRINSPFVATHAERLTHLLTRIRAGAPITPTGYP